MAFQVKYRIEFDDVHALDWKIDLSFDPWAGSITSLTATGNPLTFSLDNSSDELTDPIRPSSAMIGVYSEDNFSLIELCRVEQRQVLVEIYQDSTIYWTGFLDTGGYIETYDQPPYPVRLTASDGLSMLKDIEYKNGASYYTGRKTEVVIIRDILAKVYPTAMQVFYEYINLYDDEFDSTTADSPLEFAELETRRFKYMSCYDVLSHILLKYNAVIKQVGGLRIYRPEELKEKTVYGRYWTGDTSKASTNFTPSQSIDRISTSSDIRQVPGGYLMMQDPVEKVISSQDYGNAESWLDTWQFNSEDYITGGYTFNNWTRLTSCQALTLSGFDIGEKRGVAIVGHNNYPTYSLGIEQEFGTYGHPSGNYCNIEFEYMFYNTSGSDIADRTFIARLIDSDSYYAVESDPGFLTWQSSAGQFTAHGAAPEGPSSWYKFKANFNLGTVGPYTIQFFALDDDETDCIVGLRDVKITAGADSVQIHLTNKYPWPFGIFKKKWYDPELVYTNNKEIISKEYEADNSITGVTKDIGYILGDVDDSNISNTIEQFLGGIGVQQTGTFTKSATAFVSNHATHYLAYGVVVTSSGADIIFTAYEAGTAFTGSTTITTVTGTLDGTKVDTTANSAEVVEIADIDLTGSSGTADILAGGVTREASYNTNLTTTASDFVTSHSAAYDAVGITVTSLSDIITFTGQTGTGIDDFHDGMTITNTAGTLDGNISKTQSFAAAVAEVDTVTLDTGSGTAEILCNGQTKRAYLDDGYTTTSNWNPRYQTLDQPLIELITDELAYQGARPAQLVQVAIQETAQALQLDRMGILRDDLQVYQGITDIRDLTSWSQVRCSLAASGNYTRFTSSAGDPNISKAITPIRGWQYWHIAIRYKVISGSPSAGQIYYATSGHGYTSSYYKVFSLTSDGDWHTLVLDMSDLTTGTTDWINNIITSFRFDPTDTGAGVVIDFDLLGFLRTYHINRGKFHVKNRLWDIDLLEIL